MNVKDVTLLITRPDDLATPLAHHLSGKGLRILQEPLLQVLPLADPNLFVEAAKRIPKDAWTIFISPTAACFACDLWHQFLGDWPSTFKFAAVGQSTARVLHEKGITHVLYPRRIVVPRHFLPFWMRKTYMEKRWLFFGQPQESPCCCSYSKAKERFQ